MALRLAPGRRRDDGDARRVPGDHPPERLVNTEAWGGDWPETINSLVLMDEGGRTKTISTVLYPSKEAMDRALGTGMKGGWAQSYDRLDRYLLELAKR